MKSFVLIVVGCLLAGCGLNYSRSVLSAQMTNSAGGKIDVELIAWVPANVESVSSLGGAEPSVQIIYGKNTFVVTEHRVTLNGENFADVPANARHVRIEVYAKGFRAMADGSLLIDTRKDADPE